MNDREIAEAATPGPWGWGDGGYAIDWLGIMAFTHLAAGESGDLKVIYDRQDDEFPIGIKESDAAFISRFNPAKILEIIKALERFEALP